MGPLAEEADDRGALGSHQSSHVEYHPHARPAALLEATTFQSGPVTIQASDPHRFGDLAFREPAQLAQGEEEREGEPCLTPGTLWKTSSLSLQARLFLTKFPRSVSAIQGSRLVMPTFSSM
jgi:hypothetical protein